MWHKILVLLSAFLISVQETEAATDKAICFLQSWAGYRPGKGSFKPGNIDTSLCTHVYYAFLGVNPDGSIAILDSWNEIDLGGLQKTIALKENNPDLKVLFSVGGWNAGSGLLTGIIGSSTLRANFIQNSLSFMKQWGFDGIDIDWNFPVNSDKSNFATLIQEMKEAFTSGGYILSVTASGIPLSSYDAPKLSAAVDIFNIMTYDYYVTSYGYTGFNSPLYGSVSVNQSVEAWLELGIDASKLTMGIPFYGHSYVYSSDTEHDIGAAADAGVAGPYTQSPGSLGYNEICEFYNDWESSWDDDAQVPYKYDGNNWLSYDDAKSVELKVKFAKDKGLAGVSVWSVDSDDFLGVCGDAYPLLQTVKNNLD